MIITLVSTNILISNKMRIPEIINQEIGNYGITLHVYRLTNNDVEESQRQICMVCKIDNSQQCEVPIPFKLAYK